MLLDLLLSVPASNTRSLIFKMLTFDRSRNQPTWFEIIKKIVSDIEQIISKCENGKR
jgi:hypothetical protein